MRTHPNQNVQISLCLVTYQENYELIRFFDSIENLILQPNEIVITHNGGENITLKKLYEIKNRIKIPIKIIVNPSNNIGLARKTCVQNSSFNYIAFTDPDCILPHNWLFELQQQYFFYKKAHPNLVSICAPNRLPNNQFKFVALNESLNSMFGHGFSPQAWAPKKYKIVNHSPATNAFFDKLAIESVQNFSDECVLTCEDLELGLRLSKNNFIFILTPKPIVWNQSVNEYWEWAQRMFKFGKGQTQVPDLNKYPKFYLKWGIPVVLLNLSILTILFSKNYQIGFIAFIFYCAILIFNSLLTLFKKTDYGLNTKFKLIFYLPMCWLLTHIFYFVGLTSGFILLIKNRTLQLFAKQILKPHPLAKLKSDPYHTLQP